MKNKKKRRIIKTFITMIILGFFLSVLYKIYQVYNNIEINENYTAKRSNYSTQYEQNVETVEKNSKKVADVIEDMTKSVCGISKLSNAGGSILTTATETELGLGTGIVVSSNGYILSNNHVTGDKYSTCYVTIEEKGTYNGTVVWADKSLDLSITKIDVDNLTVANLGNSKNVRIGETVYAIGNPIGYQFRRTVTSGIISALDRTVKLQEDGKDVYMSDLIQTDATINPGNSGGPLICANGEVIGINSVKITTAEGIGFAVPIDVVKPVIESFIENGKFEEATLGIYVYDQSVSQYLNLKNRFTSGIYIQQISKNGQAFGKGLKEGDIINKIDGKILNTVNDLRQYVYTKKPGDKVTLSINNGRTTKDIEVILGKK